MFLVCGSQAATPPLPRCRACVHMDCIGVDKEPDGSLWLCDTCQHTADGLGVGNSVGREELVSKCGSVAHMQWLGEVCEAEDHVEWEIYQWGICKIYQICQIYQWEIYPGQPSPLYRLLPSAEPPIPLSPSCLPFPRSPLPPPSFLLRPLIHPLPPLPPCSPPLPVCSALSLAGR